MTVRRINITGVGGKIVNIPLHKINIASKLISEPITLGVVSKLPMNGMEMLLWNDLVDRKVMTTSRTKLRKPVSRSIGIKRTTNAASGGVTRIQTKLINSGKKDEICPKPLCTEIRVFRTWTEIEKGERLWVMKLLQAFLCRSMNNSLTQDERNSLIKREHVIGQII